MENRRRTVVAVAIAVLSILGAAVVAGSSATVSETQTDQQLVTRSVNGATNGLDGRLYLYVEGEREADSLRAALTEAFGDRGVEVLELETLADTHDAPVLAVFAEEPTIRYAPGESVGTVRWALSYSAAGNATQLAAVRADPTAGVTLSASNPFVRTGTFETRDTTRGVFSLPTYRIHLADVIGTTTADAVFAP
ncbi:MULTISPECIES: hypothetical protein [unclassified Haladaptatus]|uniref:hypothetical protein n=1 Tax=unclassified Haladaptatus TaxID=2622732 RepID=UPI0023E84BB2|nr:MULTISPECIES: hypothetical protein [unclassified Haladaptatus]